MPANLEYDYAVKSLNRALVVLFGVIAFAFSANAQINAAPPSLTSLGFGGRAINGAPPSVTSLGPRGAVPNRAFPNSAPFFGAVPGLNSHHRHHDGAVLPWGGVYYGVPYGYYDPGDEADNAQPEEQYSGGPTVFDRRGPGRVPLPAEPAYNTEVAAAPPETAAEPAPVTEQPPTVLVFKDGRQVEVENYAIVGNTLYDLSGGSRRKIPLTDLDLDATTKQNDDRGIDFTVPSGS